MEDKHWKDSDISHIERSDSLDNSIDEIIDQKYSGVFKRDDEPVAATDIEEFEIETRDSLNSSQISNTDLSGNISG